MPAILCSTSFSICEELSVPSIDLQFGLKTE